MLTEVVQRWHRGRDSYRPAREVIVPAHYEVGPIADDTTARDFVVQHHYEASYPVAKFRFGLWWGGLLVGVAVFSVPMQEAVLRRLPCPTDVSVELGRFVLLERVPANAESWMIARCFALLRKEGVEGVVSFSDPLPRTSQAGAVVFGGHVGTIYQASNAVYVGRNRRHTIHLLPDGSVICDRVLAKIRGREKGWTNAAKRLERAGAAPLAPTEDAREWLRRWLPVVTRNLRHPGKHVYLFGLDPAVRRALPPSEPYPKWDVH